MLQLEIEDKKRLEPTRFNSINTLESKAEGALNNQQVITFTSHQPETFRLDEEEWLSYKHGQFHWEPRKISTRRQNLVVL